jgi:hypothetical protein
MERLYRKLTEKAITALYLSLGFLVSFQPVLAATPNDPGYLQQASVYQQINAQTAWDITTGTSRVTVAVIDTGLDTWQDDIRPNVWNNPFEIADNGKDDDNNGYIDDVHGWNFAENNNEVRPSVFDSQDDPEAVRHGTLVAGLIGAVGNNAYEGSGLNWRVGIMPLRAIRSDGTGSTSAVAKAVDYAVDNGAQVISMSFVGTESSIELYKSLRRAYDKGAVIVTAAGNNEQKAPERDISVKHNYPACYDKEDGLNQNWILTVGSVDSADRLSTFSNYGSCVDILAPGEGIYSAERYAPQFGYADEFGGPWQGTSFATPLVAGAVALLRSLHPEWTPREVITTLTVSADSIDGINSEYVGKLGSGRLNVGRAVTMASAQPTKRLFGSFYYIKIKQLWRLNLMTGQTEKLASFPEASIIAMNTFRLDPSGTEGVTLILKRGSFYYLHILKANGAFFKEFVIKGPSGTRILQPLGAKVFSTANGLSFVIEQSNGKKVTFSLFDNRGVKKGEKTLAFVPADWEIEPKTSALLTARKIGSRLELGKYDFSNSIERITRIDKINHFYGLELSVLVNDGAKLSVLIERNNKLTLVTEQVSDGTMKEQLFGSIPFSKKHPWKLKVFPLGSTFAVLPYALASKNYSAFGFDGNVITSVKLPNLPTTVE